MQGLKKKMAILHSGDLNNVSMGGVSLYIEELIKQGKNYDITVFGTCDPEDYSINEAYNRQIGNMKYTFIPITNTKKRPLSVYYFLKMLRMKKIFRAFDIIYAQRPEYVLPFCFSQIRKRVFFAIHGSGCYAQMGWNKLIAFFYHRMEKLAISIAKGIIVLLNREEFGIPYYKKRFPKYKKKFYYGKVPVDVTLFTLRDKNLAKQEIGFLGKEVVLFLGRIDDNPKRVLLFPQICENLIKQGHNIVFLMIGDGPSVLPLKEKISCMNLNNHFVFKGTMKHDDNLCNYICGSDVSIVLSEFEGICMSAVESVACCVPVVATDVGDIPEYIHDRINGIIIPNDDNENIIKNASIAIEEILSGKYTMSNEYEKYSSELAMKELFEIFEVLMYEN